MLEWRCIEPMLWPVPRHLLWCARGCRTLLPSGSGSSSILRLGTTLGLPDPSAHFFAAHRKGSPNRQKGHQKGSKPLPRLLNALPVRPRQSMNTRSRCAHETPRGSGLADCGTGKEAWTILNRGDLVPLLGDLVTLLDFGAPFGDFGAPF